MQAKVEDADPVKRAFYKLACALGRYYAREKIEKKGRPSPLARLAKLAAYWIAHRAVLDKYGLKRIKRCYTGGAMLGPDYFWFYHSMGVNLKQIYGQTEVSGIAVLHRDDDIKFHTVGKPLPKTEIRISEEGEILIKSPAVMKGYLDNPEATAKTIKDGWLHTGDMGYIDEDGHLVVVDRLKHVIKLSTGEKVSPQFVENMLKFSPYIAEAVVFGSGRPFLVAILNIDYENVGQWARRRGIPYTSYSDLSQKKEVLDLLEKVVKEVNSKLPPYMRVKRFASLFKPLHADDGELTRTKKVRRDVVEARYRELIEAMYRGDKVIEVEATIRLEDGSVKTVRMPVEIRVVEP